MCIVSMHTSAAGAYVQYLTCALCVPVVQISLKWCIGHLDSILSHNAGAQCTAFLLYYEVAQCSVNTVRNTITIVE